MSKPKDRNELKIFLDSNNIVLAIGLSRIVGHVIAVTDFIVGGLSKS